MKLLKNLITVLTLANIFACGGEASDNTPIVPLYLNPDGNMVYGTNDGIEVDGIPQGQVVSVADNEDNLGISEQPIIVAQAGAYQVGVRTDGTHEACVVGATEQNCVINRGAPDGYKRVRWWVVGDDVAREAVEQLAFSWDFDMYFVGTSSEQVTRDTTPPFSHDAYYLERATPPGLNDPNINFVIHADATASGSCSGSAGNTVANACLTGSTTGLVEHNLDGNYHRWVGSPVCHVDYGQIFSRPGLTLAQRKNLLRQATYACFDMFAGRGLTPLDDGFICSSTTEIKTTPCSKSAKLACSMNAMGDLGNQSDVFELPPQCNGI